jgi:putative ABC transport system permease protein
MNATSLLATWSLVRVEAWLAWRNALRHRRRTAFSVLSVACGIVALVFAAGFIEWILWALREATIQSRLGHVQVSRPSYFQSGTARPMDFLLPGSSPEQQSIERVAGVRTVAARLSFSGLASHGDNTLSFLGEGVEPARETTLSSHVVVEEGSPLSSDDPAGVLVGKGLASNLGVKPGDQLVLMANTKTGGINAAEVRIAGLFSSASSAYDDSAIRVPLALAQRLLRTSGAHVWVVELYDTALTDAALQRIRDELPAKQFEVTPWYELADFYNKAASLFSRQLLVVRVIIGILFVLVISNSLSMSIVERTGEIGTSLALGVPRVRLLQQFVLEGLLLGLIGGAIGVVLGVGVARLVSEIGIPMPPPPGMARGFIGQVRVTPALLANALLLAVLTSVVASIYPAWKGSRLPIVDALRHNR